MWVIVDEKNIPVTGEVNVRFVSGMYYTMVCPDVHRARSAQFLRCS